METTKFILNVIGVSMIWLLVFYKRKGDSKISFISWEYFLMFFFALTALVLIKIR